MKNIEALISDADGTLVDTLGLIRHGQYEAARTYFEKHGIPVGEIPSYETYESFLNQAVGGSTRHTFENTARLLYAATPHHLDGMDFGELNSLLDPIQDRIAPNFVKPYEGLSSMLTSLGRYGIKLAIFTSGTPHHVVRNFGAALPELDLVTLHTNKNITDLEKLRIFEETLKDKFAIPEVTVVTTDDTQRHKPAPDSLLLAMKRLDTTPEHVLVLGDHAVDMQAGVNANAQLRVGITHGFQDAATLEVAGATNTISTLAELKPFLTRV